MRTARQEGKGNIGCLIGLVVFALIVVIAINAVPVKIAVAEFKDEATRLAEQAALPTNTDAKILEKLLLKAQELKLPVGKEQIAIRRGSESVDIEYKFTTTLDLLVVKRDWVVDEKINRPLF
jgi:hypothetical protein